MFLTAGLLSSNSLLNHLKQLTFDFVITIVISATICHVLHRIPPSPRVSRSMPKSRLKAKKCVQLQYAIPER